MVRIDVSDRPLDPRLEAILTQELCPLVDRIAKELRRQLITRVTMIEGGVAGPSIRVGSPGDEIPASDDGELRLKLRETFGGNRWVYKAQAIYDQEVSSVGFSGFSAHGVVKRLADGTLEVKQVGHTIQYNVWQFSTELTLP